MVSLLAMMLFACAVAVPAASALPASFATKGARAGQISQNPLGIAVDQETGDVYVSDTQNNRIDKFGPEGEFLLAWGWGVADGETKALQTCTTATKCFKGLEGAGAGEFFKEQGAEGIAVDNDPSSFSHGDVYVIDPHSNRVQKFGPQGQFLLMFGGEVNAATNGNICLASEAASCTAGVEGTAPGEFEGLGGRAIAVDDFTATVYVGDRNRVQRFSEEGVVEPPEVAFSEVGRIQNLALDSAKDIYLWGGLQEGVHKYNPSGTPLGTPRDEAGFGEGLSITIGPADELFVNDLQERHHILAFNAEGEQLASFDAGGQEQNGKGGIAYSEFTKALYILNEGGAVRIVVPPPPGPLILAGSETAKSIQPTTATLEASINPEGAPAEYHFQYGTTTAYGQSTAVTPLDAVNEVQSVTVAASGGSFTLAFKGEASGEIPFSATATEVQTALEAIPALGAGQVAVSGALGGPWSVQFTGSRGGQDVPELSADASSLTGSEPSAAVATTTPGISLFADRAVSAPLSGLLPGTLYHFRVVATDGSHTTDGPDQSFTTLPAVSIDGTSASEVDATSARLQAELNPHGVASEYRFEYGTTTAYGTSVPVPDGSAGSGTTDTTVSNLIQELLPSTPYHYRVIAHNALGTVVGPDRSFITQGSSSILADGRTWELVSPPNKHGAPLESLTEEGGLIQAAADGGGMAYVSLGPINGEPKGVRSPHDSQLLSTRGTSGWSTQDITTPHEEISIIRAGVSSEYNFFSEDLSSSVVEPEGVTRLQPENPANTERTPYRREADGAFVALVNAANVPAGTKFGGNEVTPGSGQWGNGVGFRTATPDLSHVVLVSPDVLAPGFAPGFFEPVGNPNLYELSGGRLTLISVLPGGEPTTEAGLVAGVGNGSQLNMRGAISTDGNRVVFETTAGETTSGALYQRDVALGQTLRLDQRQPGAAGGAGVPVFQAASSNGARIFFTDAAQLTSDATAEPLKPDLYMCEVAVTGTQLGCALSDLTVDQNAGEAANVQGNVSAIDASGGHVYFAANGVLTSTPNARGEVAVPGVCNSAEDSTCNLYEYDTSTHQISLVAVLSSHDDPDWAGLTSHIGLSNLTARSSPDGRYYTFMSQRSLTGYDNRDARSGQPDEEVYLFDASSGKLDCVSCNPMGARPHGIFDPPRETFPGLVVDQQRSWRDRWLAGSIPGWTLVGGGATAVTPHQPRYLSDSGRIFFDAADALVPQDTNNVEDVYQFEPAGVGDCSASSRTFSAISGGCASLISSGSSKEESAFLDASQSGDEAFFLTASRLSPLDVDSAFDVYDAHACSASSPCPPPPAPPAPACQGDACQNPSSPPAEQTPGSLTYKGPGNLTPPTPVPVKPKTAAQVRAQQLAKALKACKKKPRSKRAACQRQARKRYGPTKAKKTSHTTTTHKGGK
jgi:hypothetical protein